MLRDGTNPKCLMTGHAQRPGTPATDEGVLDPWVDAWLGANPLLAAPLEEFTPEILSLARTSVDPPPRLSIATVQDGLVDQVPIRVYRGDAARDRLIVYFHGGGFVLGSISVMDNMARELAHRTAATVVSVGYRLAPEHPYPAGLDDCLTVTRWAIANATDLGACRSGVVAGESAGGNLATVVSLRLRDAGEPAPAGQVLMYPVVTGTALYPSAEQFDGLIVSTRAKQHYWTAYCAGRDLDHDPYAVPLSSADLSRLPPALLVLGGCDMLRDEGRAYAARLRQAGTRSRRSATPVSLTGS